METGGFAEPFVVRGDRVWTFLEGRLVLMTCVGVSGCVVVTSFVLEAVLREDLVVGVEGGVVDADDGLVEALVDSSVVEGDSVGVVRLGNVTI